MDKNLFTSNFKKLPKAGIIFVLLICLGESGAWFTMKSIQKQCDGGDLIKQDPDIFCRKLNACHEDGLLSEKFHSKRYPSYEAIRKNGPYDIIAFGSSVGDTGWVEMLRDEYHHKILNMTPYRKGGGRLPEELINIIVNYEKINGDHKALLLHTDMTERTVIDFRTWDRIDSDKLYEKELISVDDRWKATPLKKLLRYIRMKKGVVPVGVMNIAGEQVLFDFNNINAIDRAPVDYTAADYQKMEYLILKLKAEAAQKGGQLAMIAFPTKYQQYEWLLKNDIKKDFASNRQHKNILKIITQTHHIPFLDMERAMTDPVKRDYHDNEKLLWYRCDSHMNEPGAEYTAEIVDKYLQSISSVPVLFE